MIAIRSKTLGWVWNYGFMCVCVCAYVHVCACLCSYEPMCRRARVYVSLCTCACVFVCLCAYERVPVCVCVSLYVCVSMSGYPCLCVFCEYARVCMSSGKVNPASHNSENFRAKLKSPPRPRGEFCRGCIPLRGYANRPREVCL